MGKLPINQSQRRLMLLLILIINQIFITLGAYQKADGLKAIEEFQPAEPIEYLQVAAVRGRSLAPFQLCLECKCCASAAPTTICATMPCCFGIDCQLPNKPFGVCAFVPKTCNCTSCAL